MLACKAIRGFTLVELIVVIFILALLVSLVAPKGFQQVENYQRGTERERLTQLFSQTARESFIRNLPVSINGKKQSLTKKVDGKVVQAWKFEYFWFDDFSLTSSRAGIFSKCEIPIFLDRELMENADIELNDVRCLEAPK